MAQQGVTPGCHVVLSMLEPFAGGRWLYKLIETHDLRDLHSVHQLAGTNLPNPFNAPELNSPPAHEVGMCASKSRLYVSMADSTIAAYDPSTRTIIGTARLSFPPTRALCVHGVHLFIGNAATRNIEILNADTLAHMHTLTIAGTRDRARTRASHQRTAHCT